MKLLRRHVHRDAAQRARRSTVAVVAAGCMAVAGLATVGAAPASAVGEDVADWVEVEDGVITGGPAYNSGDHSNFSGQGSYTFRETGMTSTMTVTVPEAGVYPLHVRYAAGPLSVAENVTRSMGVRTNGVRQQLQFPMTSTADWEAWRFVTTDVTLDAGLNTVALECDRGVDFCRLNFDAIQVGGLAPDPCEATPASAGFRTLFDGTFESFDGWRKAGSGGFGRQTDCTIRTVRGRGAEWLTTQQAAPYTLTLDWRREGADDESSVYLQSSSRNGADPVGGFRIPIGTDTGAIVPTGGTKQSADRTAVSRALRPAGEWNRYVVQVSASQVAVHLNGRLVNTYESPQPIATDGFIGLENRGASHVVDFKDIQIADGVVPDPDGGVSFVPVHYELDEGSGTTAANTGTDQGVGPATLIGATGWTAAGVHSAALDLPGSTGNYVDLPDNLLQDATDFSVSMWANADQLRDWTALIQLGNGTDEFFMIQSDTQAGGAGLAATLKAGGVEERVRRDASTDLTPGSWNHVAFTMSGSTGTLYLDGEVVQTKNNFTVGLDDIGTTVDNYLARNGFPDTPFGGGLDDVRLYESTLTANDVATLYADGTALDTTTTLSIDPESPSAYDAPIAVSATVSDEADGDAGGEAELWVDGSRVGDPVDVVDGAVQFPELTLSSGEHQIEVRFLGATGWADSSASSTHTVERAPQSGDAPVHYTFDEGQGTTAANTGTSSTVGPATLHGAATWAEGQYDDGVALPGGPAGPASGSSHIDLPNDITAGMDAELTVSTWLRPTALPNWTTHVQIGKSTAEFFLLQSSTNNGDRGFAATLRVDNGEQYRIQLPGEGDLPLNEWTHVVVTLAPAAGGGGTTGKIYFDGVLMAQGDIPVDIGDVAEGGTTANFIGNGSWNDPRPTERVDDFRLYGYELTADQVADLYVTPPNATPVGEADAYDTSEGEPLVVAAPGVLGNDTDADADDTLSATSATQPAKGEVSLAADGSFTYTPDAGFFGTDTFTYRVSDGTATSAATTVTITVEEAQEPPVNTAPVAGADAYDAVQDQPLVLPAPGVLANDTDADDDALTATGATQPGHGEVALAADGSFTYTPDAGFSGTDSFTYRAGDGEDTSAAATVTITVKPAGGGGPGAMSSTAVAGVALPITFGEAGSVAVVVSPDSAAGTVELRRGSRLVTTATVTGGRATLALAAESLPVGEHVLTLRYGGDAGHKPSSSDVTVPVTGDAVVKAASRTVVKAKPRKLSWKQDFKVVVKVRTILDDAATPTGRVKIRIDGKRVKTGRLNSNGRYVVKVTRNLNVGRHMIAVTYEGDSATRWSRDRHKIWVRRR